MCKECSTLSLNPHWLLNDLNLDLKPGWADTPDQEPILYCYSLLLGFSG